MSRFLRGPFFVIAAAAIFVAIVLLTSCATTEAPRTPQVTSGVKETVVYKSVLEPCIFVDEIPPRPKLWMSETQTKEKRRLAAVIDIDELDEYIAAADSKLRGCAKPREVAK